MAIEGSKEVQEVEESNSETEGQPRQTESTEAPEAAGNQEPPEAGDEETDRRPARDTRKRTGKRGIGPKEDEGENLEQAMTDKPRQARLPEMQDPAIEELETAAEAYAEVRDRRMALTEQESKMQAELLEIMDRHKKTTYKHLGVECRIVSKDRRVRVRIKKDDE